MTVLVTLDVWRVPRRAVPRALARLALDRRRLRAAPGVRFGKLLGTGTGTGFGPTDVDPTRYAALAVWPDPAAAAGFDASPVGRAWARIAAAHARLDLRPLASRGRWAGVEPWGTPEGSTTGPEAGGAWTEERSDEGRRRLPGPEGAGWQGPVLALTRARLRAAKAVTFWRAVPPVATAVAGATGLLTRFGIGEAPIRWQGTVSVWRNSTDLVEFAYRHPEHRAAITRTPAEGWYAEELFARFAVLDVVGDRSVVGW